MSRRDMAHKPLPPGAGLIAILVLAILTFLGTWAAVVATLVLMAENQ